MGRALPIDDGAYGAGSVFSMPRAGDPLQPRRAAALRYLGLPARLAEPEPTGDPAAPFVDPVFSVEEQAAGAPMPHQDPFPHADNVLRWKRPPTSYGVVYRDRDGELWATQVDGWLIYLGEHVADKRGVDGSVWPIERQSVERQWGPLLPVGEQSEAVATEAFETFQRMNNEVEAKIRERDRARHLAESRGEQIKELSAQLTAMSAQHEEQMAIAERAFDQVRELQGIISRYQERTGGADVVAAAAQLAANGAVDQVAAERDQLRGELAQVKEWGEQIERDYVPAIRERDTLRGLLAHTRHVLETVLPEVVELRAKVEHGIANQYEPWPWDRWDNLDESLKYRFAHSVQVYGQPPADFLERVFGGPFTTEDLADLMREIRPAGERAVRVLAAAAGYRYDPAPVDGAPAVLAELDTGRLIPDGFTSEVLGLSSEAGDGPQA